jgi:hypothetical protein
MITIHHYCETILYNNYISSLEKNHDMPAYLHEMLVVNIQITGNYVFFVERRFENVINKFYCTSYLQLSSRDDIVACRGFSLDCDLYDEYSSSIRRDESEGWITYR